MAKKNTVTNEPTKNNHDAYLVTFEIQDQRGFWDRREITSFASAKGLHDAVEAHWKNEHRGHKIDLVSIVYL